MSILFNFPKKNPITTILTVCLCIFSYYYFYAGKSNETDTVNDNNTQLTLQTNKAPKNLTSLNRSKNKAPSGEHPSPPPAISGTPSADKPANNDKLDPAFESWLQMYGTSLALIDFIDYLESNMPPQQKTRLLDFWYFETAAGYEYLNTREGISTVLSTLEKNSKNLDYASKLGTIIGWYNRGHEQELSGEAESKVESATNPAEKIIWVNAIDDESILKKIIYDHRENTEVRITAAQSLLIQNNDAKTLKNLLELTETQPEFQNKVIGSAVKSVLNSEELDNVISVLKNNGLGTAAYATLIGAELAHAFRQDLFRNFETTDQFSKEILNSYQKTRKAMIQY